MASGNRRKHIIFLQEKCPVFVGRELVTAEYYKTQTQQKKMKSQHLCPRRNIAQQKVLEYSAVTKKRGGGPNKSGIFCCEENKRPPAYNLEKKEYRHKFGAD